MGSTTGKGNISGKLRSNCDGQQGLTLFFSHWTNGDVYTGDWRDGQAQKYQYCSGMEKTRVFQKKPTGEGLIGLIRV